MALYDPPVEQSNVPVKPEPLTLKLSPVSVGTAAAVAGKATTNPRATLRPRPIKLRRFHRRIISTLLFQRFRAPEGRPRAEPTGAGEDVTPTARLFLLPHRPPRISLSPPERQCQGRHPFTDKTRTGVALPPIPVPTG